MNKEMINEAKDYIKPGSMSRNYKRFIQTGLWCKKIKCKKTKNKKWKISIYEISRRLKKILFARSCTKEA